MVEKYSKNFKTFSSKNKSSQSGLNKTKKDDRNFKESPSKNKSSKVRTNKTREEDKKSKNSQFLKKEPIKWSKLFPIYRRILARNRKPSYFEKFFKYSSLIKKNNNLRISQKLFTKKIVLSQIQGCLCSNHRSLTLEKAKILEVKASIYLLLKTLKNLKKMTLGTEESSSQEFGQFCLKLEKSGFYISISEWDKKRNFNILKRKIKNRSGRIFIKVTDNKVYSPIVMHLRRKKRTRMKNLIPGVYDVVIIPSYFKSSYRTFKKKSVKSKDKTERHGLIIRKGFVRLKNNYSYMTESRVSLYMATYKKKYTKLFRIMKSHKRVFRRLFFNLHLKQIRHTSRIKKRYKLYRKLVAWRKNKKARKKVGLFYFLRKRPHMLFRFYIPRHLEINYKTFNLAHLGEIDLPSVNPRISFWLNLRKLLTSLAI